MVAELKSKACHHESNMAVIVEPPEKPNIFIRLERSAKCYSNIKFVAEEAIKLHNEAPKTTIFANTAVETTNLFFWFMNNLEND